MKLHLKSFKHCFPLVLFFIFLVLPIQAKNLSVIEINGKTYQCRNCHGKEINGVADDWLIPRHSDLKADLAFNSSVPKSEGPAVQSNLVKVSEQTQECLDCHESDSPGIVSDWLSSRHAQTSPAIASKKPELAKRVSFEELSSNLSNVSVGCYECHTLNSDKHNDNFIHNGVNINVVVSPDDCATCHPVEREQYGNSKKAHALEILEKNPLYTTLVNSTIGVHSNQKDGFHINKPSEITKGKTCFACHGTKVEAKGLKKITTLYDEMEVPNLTNWPNQGVGRINPDGSKGACTACHPRHSFSIEIARKPYTCAQCHLAPDVPAWEVYKESKHGNIFLSMNSKWQWNAVPWKLGKDFKTPTCAGCHNSLVVDANGEEIVERTHNFGSRLWTRLFGLIYSHPQPKSPQTYLIKNNDGLNLPTSFDNKLTKDFLISEEEQQERKDMMLGLCRSCHNTDWVNGHFKQMDQTNLEADQMVFAATKLMKDSWKQNLVNPKNPFDESLEKKWVLQWLFYANSVRYSAAMGGPDYGTFKNGWWDLSRNLKEMHDQIQSKQSP